MPLTSLTAWMVTTCGWLTAAAAWASRKNRLWALGFRSQLRRQHFDRDHAVQPDVVSAQDDPHSAPPQDLGDLVQPELPRQPGLVTRLEKRQRTIVGKGHCAQGGIIGASRSAAGCGPIGTSPGSRSEPIAGCSRKLPASRWDSSSCSTRRRNSASRPHASATNASRSAADSRSRAARKISRSFISLPLARKSATGSTPEVPNPSSSGVDPSVSFNAKSDVQPCQRILGDERKRGQCRDSYLSVIGTYFSGVGFRVNFAVQPSFGIRPQTVGRAE